MVKSEMCEIPKVKSQRPRYATLHSHARPSQHRHLPPRVAPRDRRDRRDLSPRGRIDTTLDTGCHGDVLK